MFKAAAAKPGLNIKLLTAINASKNIMYIYYPKQEIWLLYDINQRTGTDINQYC